MASKKRSQQEDLISIQKFYLAAWDLVTGKIKEKLSLTELAEKPEINMATRYITGLKEKGYIKQVKRNSYVMDRLVALPPDEHEARRVADDVYWYVQVRQKTGKKANDIKGNPDQTTLSLDEKSHQRWSKNEEKQLKEHIEAGYTAVTIASSLNRSIDSVKAKATRMGIYSFSKKDPEPTTSEKTEEPTSKEHRDRYEFESETFNVNNLNSLIDVFNKKGEEGWCVIAITETKQVGIDNNNQPFVHRILFVIYMRKKK